MKGCTCISLSKKKVQHFNLHNSNFILAFDSLQPNSLQPVFLPFLPGLPLCAVTVYRGFSVSALAVLFFYSDTPSRRNSVTSQSPCPSW
jgi:hypothetical protein